MGEKLKPYTEQRRAFDMASAEKIGRREAWIKIRVLFYLIQFNIFKANLIFSTPLPYSVFCLALRRSASAISTRRILPLMVLGSSSTNSITRGYL